jgi:hypothetical protein
MRQAGVSVPPEAFWTDHEWESPAPNDAPAHARPSAPTPPQRGVPVRSGVTAPTLSRADGPERPVRGGPARPGAPAPRPVSRGVPVRPGVAAPNRSRADYPGRPAQGASSRSTGSARSERKKPRLSEAAIPASRGGGVPGRRTVTIRGRGSERNLMYSSRGPRRRPSERPYERAGFKPDRVAMWAVLLGLILILVAATSSHAASSSHAAISSHAAVSSRSAVTSDAGAGHLSRPGQIRLLDR